MNPSTTAPATGTDTSAARCPVVHTAVAPGCPVRHHDPARMSTADRVAHRVLRIPARPAGVTDAQAYSAFQRSMLISAVRCLLTYIVFPFVLPAVGFATGVGPVVGLAIGSVAIVCDVFSIRRFHVVGHRWRWPFTAVACGVIGLLLVLMVQDISHLLT